MTQHIKADAHDAETRDSDPNEPPLRSAGRSGRAMFERYALVGILVLLFAAFAVTIPEFGSVSIVRSMVSSQAIIVLLALTATIVLRTGDFDLSICQVMILSACIVTVLSANGHSPVVAVAVAVVTGAAVGAVNAVLVVIVGVDSFITTLGSFTAVGGLCYLVTNSTVVAGVPAVFVRLARDQFLGLPAITWYGWILLVVLWYVYQRTPLGRYLLFVGGSRSAARLAGVRVVAVRMGAFIISGLVAALIGILLAGNLGAIDPSIGPQYMLAPFAAVFLGATTIAVGRINALGTVVAVYLLIVGITGLQLLGAANWVTNVFNGLALMAAVALAKIAGRSRAT